MLKFCRIPTAAYQFWNRQPESTGPYCWTCLHQLRVDFEACAGDRVSWRGLLNFKNRGIYNGPIGWGIRASLRRANSFGDMPAIPASSIDLAYFQSAPVLPCSKAAGNIASIDDHYGTAVLLGEYAIVQDGCYRLEWWANAHSTANSSNGLIELNTNPGDTPEQIQADPYSYLFVTVGPCTTE